jgi:EmrB/QacA subfamily drug resistance transporter
MYSLFAQIKLYITYLLELVCAMPLFLALVFIGTFFSILNSSMVNVALPTLMIEFGIDIQSSTWLYTGYMLPYAIAMSIFGSLGDIYSAKRIFLLGVFIFAMGSLSCSIAGSFWILLTSRAIQALGAAAIMTNSMVLAITPFEQNRRSAVLGWWGMVSSTGSLVGPTLGGFLTDHIGWHSIFYINLPFAAAILLLGGNYIPSTKKTKSTKIFDYQGSLYLIISLVTLLLAIIIGSTSGWLNKTTLPLFGLFLLFAGLLFRQERRISQPLISLALFQNSSFAATVIVGFFQGAALFGSMLLIPMYLQNVHDFSPTYAGVLVLPLSISMMIMAPIMGKLSTPARIRLLIVSGMAILVIGIWLFSRLSLQSPYWLLATALIATGIGLGASSTPLTSNLINVVPQSQMGMASGVFNMIRYLGGVLGSTILGAFIQQRVEVYLIPLTMSGYTAAIAEKMALGKAFPEVFLLGAATAAIGMIAAFFIGTPKEN